MLPSFGEAAIPAPPVSQVPLPLYFAPFLPLPSADVQTSQRANAIETSPRLLLVTSVTVTKIPSPQVL